MYGILEDITQVLVLNYLNSEYGVVLHKSFGYPFGALFNPFYSNEPLMWVTFSIPFNFFSPEISYNIFVVATFVLTFATAYYFYSYFCKYSVVIIGMSLIFTFSPYMYYQSLSHVNLLQLWVVLLYIALLLRAKTLKSYLLTGFLLGVMVSISNYLGYFSIIFTSIFFIAKGTLLALLGRSLKAFISQAKYFALHMLAFSVVFALVFYPYLHINYFSSNQTTQVEHRGIGDWRIDSYDRSVSSDVGLDKYNRPLEDFFYFTSRPWYYFLPSPENPWFGGITENAINWLQNDWGYWLTTNYFPSEHTASYLGITNMFFALLGFVYVLKRVFSKSFFKFKRVILFKFSLIVPVPKKVDLVRVSKSTEFTQYINLFSLFIVSCFLFLLMLPPYFTISLNKIYTPSYILYLIFPMFRVLVRLSTYILLIQLVFTGFGYTYFLLLIKSVLKRYSKRSYLEKFTSYVLHNWGFASFVILLPVIFLSLMEFYVPPTFTNLSSSPKVYDYLEQNLDQSSVVAVYPYGQSLDSTYWLALKGISIVNPKNFNRAEYGFYSDEFTLNLPSCVGIINAQRLGVTHLVNFYYSSDNDSGGYFNTTNLLNKVTTVEEGDPDFKDYTYFKVYNKSSGKSFSADIYQINEVSDIDVEKCLKDYDSL